MNQKTKITVSGILQDLANGLTRTTTSKNYNPEIGCIQEKYNLTNYDLEMLFKHPKLKGRKTHAVKMTSFILEDDVDETVEATEETTQTTTPEVVVEETREEVREEETREEPITQTTQVVNDDLNAGW
jgi:hypothetical protein